MLSSTEPLINLRIKFQFFVTDSLKCCLYFFDFAGRTKSLALATLEVRIAAKLALKSITERIVLARQHFGLHIHKSLAKNLGFIATIELAITRRLCQLRIHYRNPCTVIRQGLHRQLAKTMAGHLAARLYAMQKTARHFVVVNLIHKLFFCF